ncbi:hypothetical protein IWW36_000865 [Coemansia brasiliensis]|uniref:KOW domain-containing protein n=1 Tax=Coemansia brasiliensis TaxID=2650707 RepID=A0A9W8M0X1_9FUNG|nr:hypothetical protein IWW36_000865 [Coemansia brasiliensis]
MRIHRSLLNQTSSRVVPRNKSLPKNLLLKKWKIVRGDEVMVISGKERGKTGTVSEVARKVNGVYVRGLNLVYKNVPRDEETPTGKIQKEMPIHVSNVALIDPSTNRPTKVRLESYKDPKTGKSEKRRYSLSTGTHIPKKVDLSYQRAWKDGDFDTTSKIVNAATFNPEAGIPPFPADVMREIKNPYKKHY